MAKQSEMSSKNKIKLLLSRMGLDVNLDFMPGLSVFGIKLARTAAHFRPNNAEVALAYCMRYAPCTLLDVGSGGGYHAEKFQAAGCAVTCIDLGKSVYYNDSPQATLNVVRADFFDYPVSEQFDLVWASHVLEHQRNVGNFIEKLTQHCRPGGRVCISLPFPHRRLWGGHLTYWTPGILAYNIVLCGIDISDSALVMGHREFSIVFKPCRITLPELAFDSGDIDVLAPYLPKAIHEKCDNWVTW